MTLIPTIPVKANASEDEKSRLSDREMYEAMR